MDSLAHFIAFIGLLIIASAWQFKDRRTVLALHAISFSLFAVQLGLLGAYVGAAIMAFGVVRTITSIFTQRREVLVFMIVAGLCTGLYFFSVWSDILVLMAGVIGTIAFYSKSEHMMRMLAPIGTILWASYNIINGAWFQLGADILILSSMALAAIRYYEINFYAIKKMALSKFQLSKSTA